MQSCFQIVRWNNAACKELKGQSNVVFTYSGFVKSPDTFLHPLLSPPQIPHLSNFLLEPIFPSQPALMHLPWTHTPVESGEHGVPSTTWKVQKKFVALLLEHTLYNQQKSAQETVTVNMSEIVLLSSFYYTIYYVTAS